MNEMITRPDHSAPLPPMRASFGSHPSVVNESTAFSRDARVAHVPPPVRHALATVNPGFTVRHEGLVLTPLIGDDDPACEYVTLEEAFAADRVTIRELAPWGSTNHVHVRNRGDRALLIVDGEELSGSVQDRVLNLSVLVGAHSRAVIEVSCVESTRNDGERLRFTAASRMQFATGRAERMTQVSRSIASHDDRLADQQAVWKTIHRKRAALRSTSTSSAMAALYKQHARALDESVTALGCVPRQRGAVFAVRGRFAGVELFDCASTWTAMHGKIVRSYALDALGDDDRSEQTADVDPETLLDVLADAPSRMFPSFGDGFDLRITGPVMTGAALVFGGRVVHLAAFTRSNPLLPDAV